jgi:hypothetical protein
LLLRVKASRRLHHNRTNRRNSEYALPGRDTVYEEANGETLIIDGNKRFFVLLAAGSETAPCILTKLPDTYTPSTQVIDVSPAERAKMIKKALEQVDETMIAAAIGVSSLKPGIDNKLKAKLHPTIILAYKEGMLSKVALVELANVVPKRQAEIFQELRKIKKFTLDVIKQQVLKTSPAELTELKVKKISQKNEEKRSAMIKHLEEVDSRREAMSDHYKTYSYDVAEQLIYVRGFLDNEKIEQHIVKNYPEMYKKFQEIMERK